MKRWIALLLAAVLLLSLCTVLVNAEEQTAMEPVFGDDVEIKPFYGLAWDQIDEREQSYITEFVFFGIKIIDGEVVLSTDGIKGDMDAVVDSIVERLNSRPEGMRYLCLPGVNSLMIHDPEAVVYVDKDMNKLREQFSILIKKIYDKGGKVDGLFTDLENTAPYAWYLYSKCYGSGWTTIYKEIVDHPLYETRIRPHLEERNFQFYTPAEGDKSEIFNIAYKQPETNAVNQNIWDVVMRNLQSEYLTEALFEPMIEYYPDAIMSDYQATGTYGWHKELIDDGGGPRYRGGNYTNAGNSGNLNFYSSRPGNNYFISESTKLPVYNNPAAYNKAVYEKDVFNMVMWDVKKAKNLRGITEDNIINAWVSTYDLAYGDREDAYAATPYYSEVVFHIGLQNPQPFLLYLSKGEYESTSRYNYAVGISAQLFEELTRVAGAADRKPIEVPFNWNDGYVLSGMYAGGRNIWRITPDTTDGMTVEDFLVEGDDPTFSINGKTVTFPGGKIIETAKIERIGSCGYWVETPADVMPVVKNIADRYEQYPAYLEDYEGYEAGAQLSSEIALPALCWTVDSLLGTATVASQNGNNVLSVGGTVVLRNTKLPQNVTAGDSYAKQQAAQVTVTLPAAMADDGELKLFSVSGQDEGLIVSKGKAWYVEGGARQEIAGVDLSSGGTFVFKRDFDLRNDGAYTCTYAVYNAEGKLLGKTGNIPLVLTSLPITGIAMTLSNIGGEPVLLDDYKLYITGYGSDFELYDAAAGVIEPEADKARETDTAYRYSWANGGDQVKNVSIVASYYDADDKLLTEEVVKTLRLIPGNDGVETGIVALGDKGAKVLVTLKYGEDEDIQEGDVVGDPNAGVDQPAGPTEPNSTKPNATEPGGTSTKPGKSGADTNVLIIVGAVVIGGLVVFAAAYTPAKKKPQEPTEETKE